MKWMILSIVLMSQFALANECIYTSRIRGFSVEDAHTIIIDAGRTDYVMSVSYCPELEWSHKIAFRTFSGSRVCWGDKVLVLDHFDNYVKQVCHIHKIEKLEE